MGDTRKFDWHDWADNHRHTLRAIGLPVDVYMSLEHWLDFLENGHLHWHPDEDTGFDFSDLNQPQQRHLLRFLEDELDKDPIRAYLQSRLVGQPSESFPLLGYLRHLVDPRE